MPTDLKNLSMPKDLKNLLMPSDLKKSERRKGDKYIYPKTSLTSIQKHQPKINKVPIVIDLKKSEWRQEDKHSYSKFFTDGSESKSEWRKGDIICAA